MNLVFARTPFFKQTLFDYENKQIYLISKTNQRLLENAWEVCTSVGTSVGKHTIKATKPDQVTIHHHMCWKGLGAIGHKNNSTSHRITSHHCRMYMPRDICRAPLMNMRDAGSTVLLKI